MPNAELIHSATQFASQARELLDAGARTNLIQTLAQVGHPYGLLLNQSSGSSQGLLEFCFPPEKGVAKADSAEVGLIGLASTSANSSSGPISLFSLSSQEGFKPFWSSSLFNTYVTINSVEATLLKSEHRDNDTTSFGRSMNLILMPFIASSVNLEPDKKFNTLIAGFLTTLASKVPIKFSAQKNAEFARKIHWDNLFHQQAFLAPIFLKLFTGEKTSLERSRELQVAKNSVSLGTTAIKLTTYQGEQPFVVKTPQGEPIAQINPGDQLGHLHVSHQASFMRGLSVIEKTRQITADLIDLFKGIETGRVNLNSGQQDVLTKAQNATLIGISHLVPLFRLKTGLPTWKLDVLPDLIQRFHQHDSQAVSKAFGGTRKVKVSDVEMMVVTSEMRRQLAAAA